MYGPGVFATRKGAVMEMDFYDSLYKGYTGEYQLMSALYRNGLDALRPPADMGVDVVSVNLKDQLVDPAAPPETLLFQVKTAVTTVQPPAGEGMRGYTSVTFMLKPSELDMLAATSRRALVCYVYDERNDALTDAYEAPFVCFWLDGLFLRTARDAGALHACSNGKLGLTCQLRQPPDEFGHWYVVVIDRDGKQVSGGYLGTIDSGKQQPEAADGLDHYSIKGYLDYVRGGVGASGESKAAGRAAEVDFLTGDDPVELSFSSGGTRSAAKSSKEGDLEDLPW